MEQKMETVSDLGKLFIGGISWDTDEERLREYFSKYGDLVESVIMRDRTTGRARGFGFIVFADPSVAERVIIEKHIIDGRTVEAKKAVPRDDQQVLKRHASPMHLISSPSHGGGNNNGRTKKIFVGGLPSSITEAEFKSYFDQFGTIADVVVMYDHNTQRPRGFGFITFDSEESVDMVLHKTFHELNGKMVEVKRAVPKEQPSSSAAPLPGSNRSSPVIGYGGNNYGGVVVPPNRSSGGGNSYFNSFAPGYNSNNNNIGPPGSRFSPIGSGRNAFSSSNFGLGLNQELSLNSSFDGNAIGYNNRMIPGNQYFNTGGGGGASPNRYNSPIGFNRGDSAYNPSNRDLLWGNRTDSSGGPGWNLGVSVGNNNRGNWGLSDTNGYGRSFGASSGLSALSFSGGNNNNNTNGFDGSIGELYRGSSVYSDSTWQQGLPHHQSSNELDGLSRSYGFGFDNVAVSDPTGNASEGYPGSYSVGGNRQTNRGIEA